MPSTHTADDPRNNTIATLISAALLEAEQLFGKRDESWTFTGYEFDACSPKLVPTSSCRHVRMKLSLDAHNWLNTAACELSHEVVHMLSPSNWANNLEEGLAVWFSQRFYAKHWKRYWRQKSGRYTDARRAFLKVWKAHPGFVAKLRQITPCLSEVRPNQLLGVAPTISESLAVFLCQPLPKEWRYIGSVAKGKQQPKKTPKQRLHLALSALELNAIGS
jgi:hypothetical protein